MQHVTKLFCGSCIFFLFWKFWPEVPLNTLLCWRNRSMIVFCPCENIKVCAVPLYSVSDHRNCRQPRTTEDSVRPEASLFSDVRNHRVPPLTHWSPACGAHFSLDDLQATSRRSCKRRTRHSWAPAGLRSSGEYIIIQWATSRSEPTVGFEPTREQLTSRKKYDVAKKGEKKSPPTIVSASGGADTGVDAASLTVNDCAWSITRQSSKEGTLQNSWRLLSHDVHNHQRSQQTCYTTEDRLVNGSAVSAWCNVASESFWHGWSGGKLRENWFVLFTCSPEGHNCLTPEFCLSGPTQQIESKFSDLKLKPTSWLSSK